MSGLTRTLKPAPIAPDVRDRLVRERRRARLREGIAAYAFLAPALVLFIVFLLVPIIWVVRQSFYEGGVLTDAHWVGLDNWETMFGGGTGALESLGKTGLYVAMAIPALFIVAVPVALALRGVRRGGAILRWAIYLPSLAPFVLAALVWIFLVHPDFGLLNVAARFVGGQPVSWLGDRDLALPTLGLLEIWRGVGFWSFFLLAALLGISRQLYEAAALDGASAFRRFMHVTLPGLLPTLATAILLATLFAMQVFESPFILTKGGPAGATETSVLFIYQSIFERNNPGLGAAVSTMMLLAVLLITAVVMLARRSRRSAGTGSS